MPFELRPHPNPTLRPDVMNNSWGCPTSEGCAASTLQTIVHNTVAAGIFVEVSAGNDGRDVYGRSPLWYAKFFVASLPHRA